jgi:hypothetical protein
MSVKLFDAVVYIKGDQSQLDEDLKNAEGSSKSWLQNMQQGIFQGIGQAVFGLVAKGVGAVVSGMGDLVAGAMEAEKVEAQLNAVLESTGGVAGITADKAKSLANSLASVTTFEDEAILSGENLLLTFTGIGQDVFPLATEAMLDMSTAMGQDLKSSATMLGKALNDPAAGITALTRVGVVFTDEQKKMIEGMVEMGDTAGAQKVILDELNKEFGGSAVAMGETLTGRIDILKNKFTDLGEGMMGTILGALQPFIDTALNAATNALPLLEAWLGVNLPIAIQTLTDFWTTTLAPALTNFWSWATTALVPMLMDVWNWLGEFLPVALQTLSTIWTTVLWPAIQVVWAWITTTLMPMLTEVWIWLGANLPGALQTLSTFWTTVLWPALQMVWAWITSTLVPMLTEVWNWLAANLPTALQTLSTFWTTVLQPAIQTVAAWVTGTLIPTLTTLWTWLSTTLTAALTSLAAFWETTLLPAITAVWTFISTSVMPLFNSIVNLMNAGFTLALTALAGIWENVLKPALDGVWRFIDQNLMPIFEEIGNFLADTLTGVIDKIVSGPLGELSGAFGDIADAIQEAIDWIDDLADSLGKIKLPGWMTPGSPTPWEIGLRGIGSALSDLNRVDLPNLANNLDWLGNRQPAAAGAVTYRTDQFNLAVNTENSLGSILGDFAVMKAGADF